jgi:hypothetical protein
MSFPHQRPTRNALLSAAVGGLLAIALAAAPAGAQTSTTPPGFASGSVTSVHGTSVQVTNQTQNSESTVTLSPSTQVSKRETAAASAITVGACVRVLGTGSAAKGIAATSVSVSAADANGCTGGFGGAGGGRGDGQRPNFPNGQRPNFPNGQRPNFGGRSGNRPANFAAANGPVVSVSGDKVVVKSTTFQRRSSSKKSSTKSKKAQSTTTTKPKTTTSNVTVTVGSSAAITQTVTGTTSDVAVGSCVTATGTTGAGGLDAASVVVSQPVNGTCSGGFGGFGGGPGGAAGGGQV